MPETEFIPRPLAGLSPRSREYAADASLLLISAIWGSTFIVIKNAIAHVPVFSFLSVRFMLGAAILGAFCALRQKRINRRMLRDGVILGGTLFGAFAFQTLALLYTSASVTGFITGLYVIFVPILSAVFLKKMPRPLSVAGAAVSMVGLGMITLDGGFMLSYGEFLVLVSSLFIAIHILLTDTYSRKHDTTALTFVQISVVAAGSVIASLITDPHVIPREWPAELVIALVLCGVFATVVCFLVMTAMQKFTTPTKAAIIFTMEPVSSAFFAYFIGGELLTIYQYAGAALIIGAMLLAELGTHLAFGRKGAVGRLIRKLSPEGRTPC